MKPASKTIFLSIALTALLLHFLLVFVYANPLQKQTDKNNFLVQAYVYPVFHQSWGLFAPAPDVNYRLLVKSDGSHWQDVFGSMVAKHQSNRLAGYEPLVVAFTNYIHYFEKNTSLQAPLNGPVKNDLYFTMLQYATANYLAACGQGTGHLQLRLLVENTQTQQQRVYFN